jgi:hypothetical protein
MKNQSTIIYSLKIKIDVAGSSNRNESKYYTDAYVNLSMLYWVYVFVSVPCERLLRPGEFAFVLKLLMRHYLFISANLAFVLEIIVSGDVVWHW